MMLAIDTSAGTDVAVVSRHGYVLAEYRLADVRHHAEAIGTAIESVFDEAGIGPQHIEEVVVGMGPGPFTGLRVGVAAARAFAAARDIPCIPICSHDAIAAEWRHANPDETGDLIVTTDAKRKQRACSRYPLGWVIGQGDMLVVAESEVPEAEHRVDADQVSAAYLAHAWEARRSLDLRPDFDEIIYVRPPDAVPSAGPKRVTA